MTPSPQSRILHSDIPVCAQCHMILPAEYYSDHAGPLCARCLIQHTKQLERRCADAEVLTRNANNQVQSLTDRLSTATEGKECALNAATEAKSKLTAAANLLAQADELARQHDAIKQLALQTEHARRSLIEYKQELDSEHCFRTEALSRLQQQTVDDLSRERTRIESEYESKLKLIAEEHARIVADKDKVISDLRNECDSLQTQLAAAHRGLRSFEQREQRYEAQCDLVKKLQERCEMLDREVISTRKTIDELNRSISIREKPSMKEINFPHGDYDWSRDH